MSEKISAKVFFRNWGFFMAIFAVLFGITLYSVILARKSWSKNLINSVDYVLTSKSGDEWILQNKVPISGPFSTTAAAYEVRNRKSGEMCTAVIIRTVSFYGPIPAVFICDSYNEVTFIGYATLDGRIEVLIETYNSDKRIEYWKKKIPYILGE